MAGQLSISEIRKIDALDWLSDHKNLEHRNFSEKLRGEIQGDRHVQTSHCRTWPT